MQLIFLHGAPASGKLTVAKALRERLPARLLDNHAAIDLARKVFDFGAPGFWELVYKVREAALRAAIDHDVPLLIVTQCYTEPEDRSFFEQLEDAVVAGGGRVLPVFLYCSDEEATRRVGDVDRVLRGKTTSASGLDAFRARYNLCMVPRQNCQSIDTETASAADSRDHTSFRASCAALIYASSDRNIDRQALSSRQRSLLLRRALLQEIGDGALGICLLTDQLRLQRLLGRGGLRDCRALRYGKGVAHAGDARRRTLPKRE